ncbi:Nucleobase-ascorbate transporter like [Quillaja saponaria]|uniref:Nucleobase-ascorbate transporter like n=1 Tax=Quillaja saponaria TaxID=32244 RepID=A0AAD7P696_QUISA|nr:Nucleobase-ascorbate transporter like [Quillaja saponaria]
METGSNSESFEKAENMKGGKKLGAVLSNVVPFVPSTDHNPKDLRSWARRTGSVSDYSGETGASVSEKNESTGFDLERGIEIEPVSGSTLGARRYENYGVLGFRNETVRSENQRKRIEDESALGAKDDERKGGLNAIDNGTGNADGSENRNGDGQGVVVVAPVAEHEKKDGLAERNVTIYLYPDGEEPADRGWHRSSILKCGLRENPGFVPLIFYGLEHYLSLAGSLIFIPLITVPAMGGTDKDTATVINTMLFLSGITTILHSYFGTQLPLVQGSSFVYLAPALVIMNAQEYRNLTEHKFRHIMRELQGAIIVGSIFQSILGFSGLMSFFLRLNNPIVVAPTIVAVGLAFFSYGFPQTGSCVEISLPQIVLLLIFTLYLRGISIFGRHLFQIYAVPLSVMIIWTYAFFLTAGGAYDYKGCSPNVPSSNILTDACRKHAYTMKHCRTDVSYAWRTSPWVRVPYPLQWGIPLFHLRTSIIMITVMLIASVDSVATYHSSSQLVNLKPPTPGVVSRGIALEGFCSMLAGLWGSGTGSTTLTENVHTIDITKVASRRAIVLGAAFLILFSFVGKVGAILASIPLALAASVLCFMWALMVALGLSNLQYSQSVSLRNITIVGISLFLGLSIPAYFQQYQSETSLILPSNFVPYGAASNGPVQTGSKHLDFAINALLSLNMVVTLLLAFILDNTVPGSQQERGVYKWSSSEEIAADPSLLADYSPPRKVAWCFSWAKCLGV